MKKHKQYEVKPIIKDQPTPPLLDTYPTNVYTRWDPLTNGAIPTDEAVNQTKRWVDYNAK